MAFPDLLVTLAAKAPLGIPHLVNLDHLVFLESRDRRVTRGHPQQKVL